MCGRYGLTAHQEEIAVAYPVDLILAEHHPRWNIAPTQEAPVLLAHRGVRRIESYRWGLIPHWARDPTLGPRLINARAETVGSKPAFRDAWRDRRRCLVLADGFYEWQKPNSGSGPKVPHWIQMDDGRPFALAGLWERWGPGDAPTHTFTILTTDPNRLLRPIHDRMPVILERDAWSSWIDPEVSSETLTHTLRAYPAEGMHVRPVSTHVNDPKHEGPECVATAEP
jgi:putative SOS response-associated peptidase YedK